MIVPPLGRISRVPQPAIRDSYPAGEADPPIDDHDLAVSPMVSLPEMGPPRPIVDHHPRAGLAHRLDKFLVHLQTPVPIKDDVHLDPVPRSLRQRPGESVRDVARPINVGFEIDRPFRDRDCAKHRREDLVTVHQRRHSVLKRTFLSEHSFKHGHRRVFAHRLQ